MTKKLQVYFEVALENGSVRAFELPAEQYYDISFFQRCAKEIGVDWTMEDMEIDHVSLYSDHIDYLPYDLRGQVREITVTQVDSERDVRVVYAQQFWNRQCNWAMVRSEYHGDGLKKQTVVLDGIVPDSRQTEEGTVRELLRLEITGGKPRCLLHCFEREGVPPITLV